MFDLKKWEFVNLSRLIVKRGNLELDGLIKSLF